jgi:hypothetical protein
MDLAATMAGVDAAEWKALEEGELYDVDPAMMNAVFTTLEMTKEDVADLGFFIKQFINKP